MRFLMAMVLVAVLCACGDGVLAGGGEAEPQDVPAPPFSRDFDSVAAQAAASPGVSEAELLYVDMMRLHLDMIRSPDPGARDATRTVRAAARGKWLAQLDAVAARPFEGAQWIAHDESEGDGGCVLPRGGAHAGMLCIGYAPDAAMTAVVSVLLADTEPAGCEHERCQVLVRPAGASAFQATAGFSSDEPRAQNLVEFDDGPGLAAAIAGADTVTFEFPMKTVAPRVVVYDTRGFVGSEAR